jgi:hypothetical protein
MPPFLKDELYVDVPLEEASQAMIAVLPRILQPTA